jgi:hypothetical protein
MYEPGLPRLLARKSSSHTFHEAREPPPRRVGICRSRTHRLQVEPMLASGFSVQMPRGFESTWKRCGPVGLGPTSRRGSRRQPVCARSGVARATRRCSAVSWQAGAATQFGSAIGGSGVRHRVVAPPRSTFEPVAPFCIGNPAPDSRVPWEWTMETGFVLCLCNRALISLASAVVWVIRCWL